MKSWMYQREEAACRFENIPELAAVIRNEQACWGTILRCAAKYRAKVIPRVTESEWAYRWALDIGDREIMRERVTESEWAYLWAWIPRN